MTAVSLRLAGLSVLLLLAGALPAEALAIGFERVSLEDGVVYASARLTGLLDDEARQLLASGKELDTTVRFYLYRKRENFPDKQLAVRSVRLVVLYNGVTQEYLVNKTLRGKILASRTVRSLAELEQELERLENLPLFDLDRNLRGKKIFLRARAFLGVSYVLGLIPSDRWTDRVSSSPILVP